jgi:hypothetical protein
VHSGGGDYHVLASVMSYIIRRLTLTHFVNLVLAMTYYL